MRTSEGLYEPGKNWKHFRRARNSVRCVRKVVALHVDGHQHSAGPMRLSLIDHASVVASFKAVQHRMIAVNARCSQ